MLKLFENIVQKRRYLIVDEADVMNVLTNLSVIKQKSRFHDDMGMEIGKSGWTDKADAWFIEFDSTMGQWRELIVILKKHGYKMVLNEHERCYVMKEGRGSN